MKRYVDSFDPTQDFPFERRCVRAERNIRGGFTPIIYRYQTAEDRENHLKVEAAALRGWRP